MNVLSVCPSVCPAASALWKNGGSDPDAVWHRRSDGSSNEAGGGVWRSVHGKGYFWGRIWGAPLSTGTWVYVRYSAATQPSCQITLGRLVNTVSDSSIMLMATLLQVVDYSTSYELTGLRSVCFIALLTY